MYADRAALECDAELAEADLLEAKTRTLEAELLRDLYGPAGTLKALRVLRAHLGVEARAAGDALERKQAALTAYRGLGREFEAAAAKYAALKADLASKKMSLEKVKDDLVALWIWSDIA